MPEVSFNLAFKAYRGIVQKVETDPHPQVCMYLNELTV